MPRLFFLIVLMSISGILAYSAWALDLRAGELALTLAEDLSVTGMAVGSQAVSLQPCPLVSLWASDTEKTAFPSVRGGQITEGLQLLFAEARASGVLQITTRTAPTSSSLAPGKAASLPSALHFRCVIKGEEGPDRGFLLRFSFPVQAIGWRWHDDMQTARVIASGAIYENVEPLRAYADLPEWRDKPALRMGYANRHFCTAICGPVGIALAVPLDQPRLFRTAYDSSQQRLEIVYDFALSGLTRAPYEASFEFDLYACDPQWGMRSALQRYYALYPEMFRVYVPVQGQWMAFNRLSEIDNANEFLFGLQEGAPEPEYDDKIGVLSATYYTHAGMGANLPPPYDPEKDPLPPYEELVKAVDKAFERITGQAGLYEQVGTRKPDGKLAVEKWSVYSHLIAQFNLDPDLPWGKFLLEGTLKTTQSVKERTGGNLDGFYYDGLTHGLNYCREHFKTADAPLLWDPVHKQAFLYNFFSSIEFARATAELLRPRGQITMMNGGLSESFYVVPWLDILGAETGLIIPRAGFNFVRASLYHKPFLTLLKGNYEQKIGRAEIELFMKRCLAYGVFPGFFDWPPSGLGPGGRYWDHARYYERDRDLHRKYQPLCQALALAGWEPVTHARSSEPNVYVERFGSRDIIWLTLLNEQAQPFATTLTVDAAALGLNPARLRVTEMLSGRTIACGVKTPNTQQSRLQSLSWRLTIPAQDVLLLQLGAPEAVAAWHLQHAQQTLERGRVQRALDADKPPLLVHWRPWGKGYRRETNGDKTHVVFVADGKNSFGMKQWIMLFQNMPQPLKIRARVAAENFTAGEGGAILRCQLARVTPSYTHYERKDFALPEGTYDWREMEFDISSEYAWRAMEFFVILTNKAQGTLKIAALSVTDDKGEHVIDGNFNEWYEPFPTALREPLEKQIASLENSLMALRAKTAALSQPAFRQALSQQLAICHKIEDTIHKAQAENGARRMLRDVQTVRAQLSAVMLAALNMSSPAIEGPSAAAPGDTIKLRFAMPASAPRNWPVRLQLRSAQLAVTPEAGGGLVTIPAHATPGATYSVEGLVYIGPAGQAATLQTSHTIRVLTPLELRLKSEGFDTTTGAARIRVFVRNNHVREIPAQLQLSLPTGWKPQGPLALRLPAQKETIVDVTLQPHTTPAAGPVEIFGRVLAGAESAQAQLLMLYIPPQANLIPNPGFEEGIKPWATAESEAIQLVTDKVRSGTKALCLNNPTRRNTQVSCTVMLHQQRPTPILVQAASRAENVEGLPDSGYSLYVDIYYMDGTPSYGHTFNFQTGTTDWQWGELYLEPAKPIRNVNVYLLLRGKAGKAYFDDVALMEDSQRKGNMAREAQIRVDSNFSGYNPAPLNDGIIRAEGLHWTQEAWASAETETEHFVELEFPAPVAVQRLMIYWSLDAGIPRTSRTVAWQIWEHNAWRTLQEAKGLSSAPYTELKLTTPVTGQRFRLWQPPGQGPQGRPHLMWIREIELYGP